MALSDVVLAGNGGSPDECWRWPHARFAAGYGSVTVDGRTEYVHRLAYAVHVGPIPDGLHIDHLCRVRECWNPRHLEAVSLAENNRRAASVITHCPQGHDYAQHARPRKRAGRDCGVCHRDRERRRRSSRPPLADQTN